MRRALTAGAVVAALLLAGRQAGAHVPPSIELSAKVDAEAVRLELRLLEDVFARWFGVEAATLAAAGEGPRTDALRAVEAKVDLWSRVAIDRVPVRGVVERVERRTWQDHGLTRTYAVLGVAYGAKGAPRQVSIAWTQYEGANGGGFDTIETEVEGFGETSYFVLRASEPELVWHRPKAIVVRDVPVPRPRDEGRRLVVSLPAAALGLLLLLLALLSLRVRGLRRPVLGALLCAVAIALGVADVLPVEVPLPGARSVARPSPDEAASLFESLLRNVYRAFDYDREDAVYDTLAHSVTGPLLDRVYEEVYAGLVMKEQGGAVSKVEKVDLLERDVTFPAEEGDPSFRVRGRWHVHGKVGHWGHTHRRVNEHEAVYTVAPEGDRWKIVGVQVLSQKRVDTGEER